MRQTVARPGPLVAAQAPMIDLIAAAGFVLAASLLIGSALGRLCGASAGTATGPAAGLALLLIVSSVTIRLPGRAMTSGLAVLVMAVGSGAYLLRSRTGPRQWGAPIVAGLLAGTGALIPFLATGRAGILGVGTNDDMAEHLLAAWTLQGHLPLATSKLISSGYPVGPHSLAATVAQIAGISLEHAFIGELLAVPMLLALTAAALMPAGRALWRGGAGAAVGVCYLQAAFLVQASFKEPIEALMLIGLAGGVHRGAADRAGAPSAAAMPLAVLAAGAVYVDSYLGLAWLVGTLVLWGAGRQRCRIRARRRGRRTSSAGVLRAGAVFVVLVAPEIPRMIAFLGSGYNREGSAVFGNLLRPLPPLEATGIWPSVDFRFNVPLGSISGILAVAAVAAVAVAVWRSVRRGELALPAALAVAAAIWAATSLRSPYTAAKSLAVLAPVFTLLMGREMLLLFREPARTRRPRMLGAAFALLLVVGGYSDLKVLRDAPVGPSARSSELASLRPRLAGRPTLFLGADDYVHWELRGADVATPPSPLYTRTVVPLRRAKARQDDRRRDLADTRFVTFGRFAGQGLAFDFDSVPIGVLDRFAFVIVPRSAYGSAPPRNWRLVRSTRSYELWRRVGATLSHRTLTEVDNPGATLDCTTAFGRRIAAQPGMAMVKPAPVVGWRWWWRGRVGYAGRSSEMTLRLGRGTWDISLQYDSVVPVTVSAAGLSAVLPPNLEPLGPYSSVGVLRLPHVQSVRFVLHYHRLPLPGRLLGSTGETRAPTPTGLVPRGRLVAVQGPFRDQAIPLHQACGRYVDWYRVFRPARLGK